MSCASGWVVLGIVGGWRAALGFGLHLSEQIFIYLIHPPLYSISHPLHLCVTQFPVLSSPFSLPSCILLYSHHVIPQFSGSYFEAGADSRFVIALRVTPVPCTRPRLPWGRTRHVAAYLQYVDIAAARHVVYPRVGTAGTVRRAGEHERHGTSLRTTPPPATGARARLPKHSRWSVSSSGLRARGRRRLGKGSREGERDKVKSSSSSSTLPFADIGFTLNRSLFCWGNTRGERSVSPHRAAWSVR
jgi:hypothetical protein